MEPISNSVLVQGASLHDIERMIDKAVRKAVSEFYDSLQNAEPALVRRKDAAARLGVSLPTLDAYARAGIVHARHIGGRVFYDEAELSNISPSPSRSHRHDTP